MTTKTNKLITDILQRIDTLESVLPKDHLTIADALETAQRKKTLWDAGMKSEYKGKWIPKYVLPHVMGDNGKMVRADKVMEQYTNKQHKGNNIALDSQNPSGGGIPLNQLQFNALNRTLIDSTFLGYAEYSLLSQNGILSKICNLVAEEMWRKGIEFKGSGDEDKTDKILELTKEFERLGFNDVMRWASYITLTQGGSQVYAKLKNDDDIQDTELFIDSTMVGKGDLEYIGVVEPTWYVPVQFNTTQPRSKWFYVPEYWVILGVITHTSRLFQMIDNECLNLIKPLYLFNGIPMLQQMIPYVSKFEVTYNNIITIIGRYNLSVLKTDQESIIDDSTFNSVEQAAANFKNRIEIFNTFRDNTSTLALAKDEEFQQVQMSLGGLRELLDKALELIAIIPGCPITKLFGSSPAGLQSTGEFELRNWYDHVHAKQENMCSHIVTKIMHLAMLNLWGEIDEDITYEFVKLYETNPVEDAQVRLTNAQTDDIYINNQTLSQYEVKQRLIADIQSGYDGLESEEIDIENMVNPFEPEVTEQEEANEGNTIGKQQND